MKEEKLARVTAWQATDDFGGVAAQLGKVGVDYKVKQRRKLIRWRNKRVTQFALFRRV